MSSRIKTTYSRDEKTPVNIFTDHDWFRAHEKELLEKYGECCILIFQEEVIGVGATYDAAIEDAEKNLVAEISLVTPIVEILRYHHPFLRVRPKLMVQHAED